MPQETNKNMKGRTPPMPSKKNADSQDMPCTKLYCLVCIFDDTRETAVFTDRNYKVTVRVGL